MHSHETRSHPRCTHLKQALDVWVEAREGVPPEAVHRRLDELDESHEKPPRVRPVHDEPLQQHARQLLAHHFGDGRRRCPGAIAERAKEQARAEERVRVGVSQLVGDRVEERVAWLQRAAGRRSVVADAALMPGAAPTPQRTSGSRSTMSARRISAGAEESAAAAIAAAGAEPFAGGGLLVSGTASAAARATAALHRCSTSAWSVTALTRDCVKACSSGVSVAMPPLATATTCETTSGSEPVASDARKPHRRTPLWTHQCQGGRRPRGDCARIRVHLGAQHGWERISGAPQHPRGDGALWEVRHHEAGREGIGEADGAGPGREQQVAHLRGEHSSSSSSGRHTLPRASPPSSVPTWTHDGGSTSSSDGA